MNTLEANSTERAKEIYKAQHPKSKVGAVCRCGAKMWNHRGESDEEFFSSIRKSGWKKDKKGVITCPHCAL